MEAKKVKQKQSDDITLSYRVDDYLADYLRLHPGLLETEARQHIERNLSRIQAEIKQCQDYHRSKDKDPMGDATVKSMTVHINQLLGWDYSQNRNLETLGLSTLVPVVNTNLDIDDFQDLQAFDLAQAKANRQAKKAANQTLSFLKKYFLSHGPHYSSRTKDLYAGTDINVAKFEYRDITDTTEYADFEDIAVIRSLRAYRAQLPKESKKIKENPYTLDESLQILEHLKFLVDDPHYYSQMKTGKIKIAKRRINSIARELRILLAFCFLVAIPPLRARTLAEIELDRTLLHGLIVDDQFIPRDKLPDPTKARYYYNMLAGDYKTGKAYGDFFLPLFNHRFEDGSHFFDYLDLWLYGGYRDFYMKSGQTHQRVFVAVKKSKLQKPGDPIDSLDYSQIIRNMTKKFTGHAEGAQIFRSIYRTHFVNLGASPQALDALAFSMQHSPNMANSSSYTRQTLLEKLGPWIDFLDEIQE